MKKKIEKILLGAFGLLILILIRQNGKKSGLIQGKDNEISNLKDMIGGLERTIAMQSYALGKNRGN